MNIFKKTIRILLPQGSKRKVWFKMLASKIHLTHHPYYDRNYQRWMEHTEPETFLPVLEFDSPKPLFSIVVPFYNTKDKYLYVLLDSIANQSFQSWELIAADASTDKRRAKAIAKACEQDERIKYHRLSDNQGISGNTNQALEKAIGKYIVFCDHDDILSPHALNEVAHRVIDDPEIDIVYSDEDKLSDDGKWRHRPLFKPSWSPHTFLHTNYTNHLSVIRKELIDKVEGLNQDLDGSQDYDLLLRIHAQSKSNVKVAHVAKVLYHWREADGSTAINHNSKSYAFEAGRKALQNYINSTGLEGAAENVPDRPGFYRVVLKPKTGTKALVLVGPFESAEANGVVADRLKSLTNTDQIEAEFKAVGRSELEAAPDFVDNVNTMVFKFRKVAYPEQQNWLEELAGVLELPDVHSVAPRILSADGGMVVDMGLVKTRNNKKTVLFKDLASTDQTRNGITEWVRDVDELTGAVVGFPKQRRDNGYRVVWSHVNLRQKQVPGDSEVFLNPNLSVRRDGQITVNE